MKTRDYLMHSAVRTSVLAWLVAAASIPLSARVLDNFDAPARSGWTDFAFGPGLGVFTQAGGQMTITVPGVGQPLFAAATKNTEAFTLQPGRTLEFRVDLISGSEPKAVAVLGWFPDSQKVSTLSGYGLAVSSDRIVVTKGLGKYFYDGDAPTNSVGVKSDNTTLVLSLTQQGANVIIRTEILDKDADNAVLFDKTFVDTPDADVLATGADSPAPPWTGIGHVALLNYADEPSSGASPAYEVVYDNLAVYVLDNQVLDNFDGATKTGWTDFAFGPGLGVVTQTGGQFVIDVPGVGQPLFAASLNTTRTFEVKDGDRIELRADLVSCNDLNSVAVLGWFPAAEKISTLSGYGLAVSGNRIVVTKGLGQYFYDGDAPTNSVGEAKSANMILVLTLTGDGTSVIIQTKILDKDADNAVLFDKTFVDTAGADVLATGTDQHPAPWSGLGHYALLNYADEPSSGAIPLYEVIYDNAEVSAPPVGGNIAPTFANILPISYTNYVPASAMITFSVMDDKALSADKISVVLNGQTFTTSNGLTVSGSGTNLTGSLGGLVANTHYVATLKAVDSDGVTTTEPLVFDTFLASDLVIEAEDYNFDSGHFIDNPIPIAEGGGPQADSYSNQTGVSEVDFTDTRTSPNGTDTMYRTYDPVRMQHSLDVARQRYLDAGGTAASVYDYDVGDVAAGEWLNYTRTFAVGSYEIYLREALFNIDHAETQLALVTSDPSQPNQTLKPLGSFLGSKSGFQYANVPLTDGTGRNKAIVRLNGAQTLRLVEVTPAASGAQILQNYLILVPVEGAGVQRANVSSLSPADGTTVVTATPVITASIQNRDTSVKPATIKLSLNGAEVAPSMTNDVNGSTLSYSMSPLPDSGATNTAVLVFQDSENVSITNQWTFVITYISLDPANRQPGPGLQSGFKVRVVQAPQGSGLDNTLIRAEEQLKPGSSIPVWVDNTVFADLIDYNQVEGSTSEFGATATIPGVDGSNGLDDYTMEIKAYLDLSAGAHRFGVTTDDGYKIVSGAALGDTVPMLGFHSGGPANETFDFVVKVAGLYPFRMVWYNRGGAGYGDWFSVDLVTGAHTLINDPNTGIKAYVAVTPAPVLRLESVANLGDVFAPVTGATINTTAKTITLRRPADTRFYRINAVSGTKLKSITTDGANLVLTYEPAP